MRAEVISRETFVPSPGTGKGVMGGCFYTQNEGLRLMSTHVVMQRSDTVEVAYIRYSPDNGKTWEENYAWPMRFAAEGGSGRRHFWEDIWTRRRIASYLCGTRGCYRQTIRWKE